MDRIHSHDEVVRTFTAAPAGAPAARTPAAPSLAVEVEDPPDTGYVLARVRGVLAATGADDLRTLLGPVAARARIVVVDLDGVLQLSASALRYLLELREDRVQHGGALHLLCGPDRPARTLMRALGVAAISELPERVRDPRPAPLPAPRTLPTGRGPRHNDRGA